MNRFLLGFLVLCVLLLLNVGVARAQEPVVVVHEEPVQVGPYKVTIGFSEWPMHADRSLDIVFMPDGGIADKRGTVTLISPTGDERVLQLVRHPRMRSAWGLDIIALPAEGRWTIQLALDGPAGSGVGRVPVALGPRPGPSIAVGWIPTVVAAFGIMAVLIWAWWRIRPTRHPETWAWSFVAHTRQRTT